MKYFTLIKRKEKKYGFIKEDNIKTDVEVSYEDVD